MSYRDHHHTLEYIDIQGCFVLGVAVLVAKSSD